MTDLLIKNADIIDGIGVNAFRADLVVSNGMITHMDSDIDMACYPSESWKKIIWIQHLEP